MVHDSWRGVQENPGKLEKKAMKLSKFQRRKQRKMQNCPPQNGQTLDLQRHAASPAGSVETILELDEPSWPCEIVIFPFCLDNRIQLLQKISSCYSYCYCYPAILRDFSIRGKHGGTIHVKTRQQRNVSMSRKFNAFLLVRQKPFQHQIHRRNLQLLGNVFSALYESNLLVSKIVGITGYYYVLL